MTVSATTAEVAELVEALVREAFVADREHLVHQQHVGVDVNGDREPEHACTCPRSRS